MHLTRVTATVAARNLSDLLSRVRYRGETFLIVRGKEEIGVLRSPGHAKKISLQELVERLEAGPKADSGFAADLAAVRASRPPMDENPWDT